MQKPATLVIVGEGEARNAIQSAATSAGLDRLIMPGHLPDPHRFLGLFDVFALSSDSEQFPISLAEAMAAGLAAVCTDVGDVAAMVSAPNRPFVVPAGDLSAMTRALDVLAGDDALRARIGEANRHKAEECFSDQAMVDAYATVYGDAIGTQVPFGGLS